MDMNTPGTAIPILIPQAAHRLAAEFARQQPTSPKAQQVYCNTLAVYVVNNYLRILGIPTNLTAGDCWNPFLRLTTNTADLEVVGYGRLECRPVSEQVVQSALPTCYVPTEVQEDRIGYVVVQLDQQAETALLHGFIERVESQELPLSQLRSLLELPIYLHQIKSSEPVSDNVTRLSQWLQDAIEGGWRSLEELIEIRPVAWQWRSSSEVTTELDSPLSEQAEKTDNQQTKRGKFLTLSGGNESGNEQQILLVVGVTSQSATEFNVQLTLYPADDQSYLPPELQVTILDTMGTAVMQAQAREMNRSIGLELNGERGDAFCLQVTLKEQNVVQSFVI